MSQWNPAHYLRYGDERTRPAADLLARIHLDAPRHVADLGCGPGNSTSLLWDRWPQSQILGIDNSPEMIDAAKKFFPDREWLTCDISRWNPSQEFDLIYSNAALQWIPGHEVLLQTLIRFVRDGGACAFQIPSATFATVRRLIFDISRIPTWNDRMHGPRSALTMESPAFYYDALVANCVSLDIWETEYFHVMESHDAIIDWIASTGLRPFMAALDTDLERNAFVDALKQRVTDAYEPRSDGRVLFPFRRTFVIAYR